MCQCTHAVVLYEKCCCAVPYYNVLVTFTRTRGKGGSDHIGTQLWWNWHCTLRWQPASGLEGTVQDQRGSNPTEWIPLVSNDMSPFVYSYLVLSRRNSVLLRKSLVKYCISTVWIMKLYGTIMLLLEHVLRFAPVFNTTTTRCTNTNIKVKLKSNLFPCFYTFILTVAYSIHS